MTSWMGAGRDGELSPCTLPPPTEWPASTWTEMGLVAFLGLCPQRESGRTLASSAPVSNMLGGSAGTYSGKFLECHLPRQKDTASLPRRAWTRSPSWQKQWCTIEQTAPAFDRGVNWLFESAQNVYAATGPVVV